MLQSDPYGNLVTEVRLTCEYLLDSPWQFLGWGVLEQIARSAGLKCRRHEGWVVMHAEDKNLRPRVTQSDPSNQRQATKIPCTHLKIDHHRVGMAPVVESVAGHEVTSFENRLNSSILEGTPASRKDDRMIINHENASHSPLCAAARCEQTLRADLLLPCCARPSRRVRSRLPTAVATSALTPQLRIDLGIDTTSTCLAFVDCPLDPDGSIDPPPSRQP